MGGPKLAHPDQQLLTDFGLGKLDPAEASEIEAHLAGCEKCADTLTNLKDDTFAGLVRSADLPSELAATDGDFARSADTAQTILVQSGDPVDAAELPAELQDHPRYRIEELIGRGGMGDVYRAEHKLMNRSVAVKLINSKLINHPQAVDRFRREVQAAAQLAHSNIVTAYDAEQAGDAHFLVMEYVEGTDLASLVKQRGPFSVPEACRIIKQAAEGLEHANEIGMVHRDVKPHNLMISSSGTGGQMTVKILDFGLAGFATEAALYEADAAAEEAGEETVPLHLTTIGSVMGTPDYISPEQAKDAHTADIRADIYSLGCTLCFLLTGEPPFRGENVMEKLKAHIEDAPPQLDTIRDDVPQELVEIVHKMLAKDPDERYQTPAELAEALELIEDDFGVEVVSVPDRKLRRRWPGWAKITAGFLAALLLGVVLYVATDTGKIEVKNQAGAIGAAKVVLLKKGEEYATFDLSPGFSLSTIRAGEYQIKLQGAPPDVKMNVWTKRKNKNDFGAPEHHENNPVVVYRGGDVLIEVTKVKPKPKTYRFRKLFQPNDVIIAKTGVTKDQGGWKITASKADTQTVRLFEVKDPQFAAGQVTYRAKLKTENVKGQAYLEMWVRLPSQGEFFSKGIPNAVSGTNEWTEYEIPFLLEEGQVPDLVKLNLVIEGTGTVWIKDVELSGLTTNPPKKEKPNEVADQKKTSAAQAAEKWLDLVDADKFDEIWGGLAAWAKQQTTMEQVQQAYSKNREQLGQPLGRTLQSVLSGFKTPGIPAGEYVAVLFETKFSKKGLQQEQVVLVWDKDDWRVVGYHFTPVKANTDDSWTPLFNGKDLTGWKPHPNWRVENGVLVGSGPVNKIGNAMLASERTDFADFHLRAEARLPDTVSDSGVIFRWTKGSYCEANIGFFPHPTGSLDIRKLNSESHDPWMDAPPGVVKLNEWFVLEVIARGQHLITKVNGEITAETKNAGVAPRGQIYLQQHGEKTIVEFRKIEIKELASAANDQPKTAAPEAVKPGVNLITDPSLENTALGEKYPKGWGTGNIQPQKSSYRHKVAAEARTGKHGWLIEGDGEFASIPTDRPLVNRAFRYGGRCWVKLERGTAVLGILYFDKRGAYIPGASTNIESTNPNGWHELKIADDLADVPNAHRLSLTLTLRGKGKAVFDDLEFIAYEKNNLPEDFEAKFGKPKPDPELFTRWEGRWNTTAQYKLTAGNPGRTVNGKAEVRKILDDEFLLMQWAAEAGDEEYLLLWAWNEYANAYQMWIFGSGGEAYERMGYYDAKSKTLKLNVKPPVPGITGFSTDRFVENNRIESTLLVKSPKGEVTIDLNMTAVSPPDQKSLADKLRLSQRRAKDPAELAKLDLFAGKWKLESTLEPSVNFPEGKTKTETEHADWAVGGRYLLFQSYGADEKRKAIGLMTWVPGKNVYRYWHFAKGVYGGQWDITENPSGTGFNWKAIDMPVTWVGTAFNQMIDADTWDDGAFIKDDQGRVILDVRTKKTRIK